MSKCQTIRPLSDIEAKLRPIKRMACAICSKSFDNPTIQMKMLLQRPFRRYINGHPESFEIIKWQTVACVISCSFRQLLLWQTFCSIILTGIFLRDTKSFHLIVRIIWSRRIGKEMEVTTTLNTVIRSGCTDIDCEMVEGWVESLRCV